MPITKEMAIPIALVVGLLANATAVSVWAGKRQAKEEEHTAIIIEVRQALKEIQGQLRESERAQFAATQNIALLTARVGAVEKFIDSQAALNARVLGHLERTQLRGE